MTEGEGWPIHGQGDGASGLLGLRDLSATIRDTQILNQCSAVRSQADRLVGRWESR